RGVPPQALITGLEALRPVVEAVDTGAALLLDLGRQELLDGAVLARGATPRNPPHAVLARGATPRNPPQALRARAGVLRRHTGHSPGLEARFAGPVAIASP
ncbi:MAG: hypothetical protein ABSF03_22180, partial [Streptosporangiaceae bacterium]